MQAKQGIRNKKEVEWGDVGMEESARLSGAQLLVLNGPSPLGNLILSQ